MRRNPEFISRWLIAAVCVAVIAGISGTVYAQNWVAYNDCVYASEQYINANATTYNIGNNSPGPNSGFLKDIVTGETLPVTVTLTQSGNPVWQSSADGGGTDCNTATDAYDTFGGIVDMAGVIYYGSTDWYVDITFTGLNPEAAYEFATSANRNNAGYTTRRTIYTVMGADSCTNASTDGVTVNSNESVRIVTGYNTENGYVARWTDINPGADGSFTVRATDGSDDNKGYSFDVFMLSEVGALPLTLRGVTVAGPENTWHTDTANVNLILDYQAGKDENGNTIPIIEYLIMETTHGQAAPTAPVGTWQDWDFFGLYDIDATQPTEVTLHVWLRDENDTVAGPVSDWIVYSEETPDLMERNIVAGPYSIDIDWWTDDLAIGWIEYREADSGSGWLIAGPYDYGIQHVFTLSGLNGQTDYELVLHCDAAVVSTIDDEPIIVSTTVAMPVETDVTWSGGLGFEDIRWSSGQNWVGGYPPANPLPATINLLDAGHSTTSGDITAIVDPHNLPGAVGTEDTWSVDSIFVNLDGRRYHTLSLEGQKTLKIENQLDVDRGRIVPVNGVLDIDPSASVILGRNTIGSDFNANHAVLDLSSCSVPNNTFHVRELMLGINGNYRGADGRLIIRDSSNLQKIQVDEYLAVAVQLSGNSAIAGFVGIPDTNVGWDGLGTNWWLPENIDIQIGGTSQADVEFATRLQHTREALAIMRASAGGALTLNVNSMQICANFRLPAGGYAYTYALADFENMESCSGSIEQLLVGANVGALNNPVTARLSLPPGTLQAGSVKVGDSTTPREGNWATLRLRGTKMSVTGSLTVENGGIVETIVNGESAGLDITSGAAVSFEHGGALHFTFAADPDETVTGEYYALRWAGPDRRVFLSALEDAGKLTYTVEEGVIGDVGYAYDGTYTYVSLKEVWPPTVITKDITVEVRTADPTEVVINAKDIDELAHITTVTRQITHPNDLDEDPETVTLSVTPGEYELTLILTALEGGDPTTDTATMTVIVVPEATDADLTWSGEASLLLGMDRHQWLWGQNWVGDTPPANPTNATLTFANAGDGTSKLDANRTVRYIEFNNTTRSHTIDLDGNKLTIAGEDETEQPLSGRIRMSQAQTIATVEVEIANGLLQIGTPEAGSSLIVGSQEASRSTMKISSQLLCYGDEIRVGPGRSAIATLDLTGSTIPGGALRTRNLEIGSPDQNSGQYGYVKLSESMGLQELVVTGDFLLGYGRPGEARIGIESEAWKLPQGVSLTLGEVDEETGDIVSRGLLRIARSGYHTCDAQIIASSGGVFTAALSELSISLVGDQGHSTGLLDLRNMDSCDVDATTVNIGHGSAMAGRTINASVYLPQGTMLANAVNVGIGPANTDTSASILQLNDTIATVAASVAMGATGTIEANIGGASSGLNLTGRMVEDVFQPTTITVADGSIIRVNFLAPPVNPSAKHYGLRWEGTEADTADRLALMETEGNLEVTIDPAVIAADPNAAWAIEYDDVEGCAYVVLTAELPDYSTYAFDIDVPEDVYVNDDTVVPVTLESVEIGEIPYDAVRISFDAAGPGDVTFTAGEYSTVNTGYWGPEEGFALPAEYSDTVEWTLNFSAEGEYTITFRCFAIGSEEYPFAEDSVVVNVTVQPLYGDADRDGAVTLLDLVFVRNRLFADAEDPGNAPADINGNGSIDLDDLIEVRNNLGAVAE